MTYGQHDENTIAQMDTCMNTGSAPSGVLCADGHLGYNHPIGGVVGYTDHISVSGVGFDIACGNKAIRLDTRYDEIACKIPMILADISKTVSFGVGRVNNERVDDPLFESPLWKDAEVEDLKGLAASQLGTVGSGNHYVDLFRNDEGYVWIGVHFGSRGLGHKITTKYLAAAGAKDNMVDPPALITADSALGDAYWTGLQLGGLYAYAGRDWVTQKVRQIIGGTETFEVHNHHNFCWVEEHFGERMYVVRKGATPAFPDQYGFVGGSMGDDAVVLRGIESQQSADSMYSTVHGAGRVMSRTEARGRFKKSPLTGKKERQPGRVRHDEWQAWMRDKGVHLIRADLDEAPQAYQRLPEVLAAHAGTIEVTNVLHPVGVIMAGADTFDPYKD